MPQLIDKGGHTFSITAEQARGEIPSVCPECGWRGGPKHEGVKLVEDAKPRAPSRLEESE